MLSTALSLAPGEVPGTGKHLDLMNGEIGEHGPWRPKCYACLGRRAAVVLFLRYPDLIKPDGV